MRAFERYGSWWLPSAPDHVVGGVLSYTNDREILLRVIGRLGDRPVNSQFDILDLEYPLILGVIDGQQYVTLCHCTSAGGALSLIDSRPGSMAFAEQSFRAEEAYLGIHFTDVESAMFDSARVEFSFLPHWAKPSGFLWKGPADTKEGSRTYTLSYTEPSEITARVPGATLRVTTSFHGALSWNEVSMVQHSHIKLNLNEPAALKEWLKRYVSPLQDLLSLATGKPNAVTRMIFQVQADGKDGLKNSTDVEAIFTPVFYEEDTPKRGPSPDLLFSLSDLENLDFVLNQWSRIRSELEITCNLYFGAMYAPARYLDSRFLLTIQAVEMYHRARNPDEARPDAEHGWMNDETLSTAPKGRGQRVNEPPLRDRVKALLDVAWDILEPLIDDRNEFAERVANTRNYYTHYSLHRKATAARGMELDWINDLLFVLLQRCFLRELGFSSEQCVTLFEKNNRYNRLKRTKNSWNA